MVWHDGEAVELEFAVGAIAEDCLQEKIGVGWGFEVGLTMKGRDRDGVGFGPLADRRHGGEHTPGAKALYVRALAQG